MLSPEVAARLEAAKQAESYKPLPEIAAHLGEKVLVMEVGPARIGKSHTMNKVVEFDSDFQRVPVFTSRPPRPDDEPGMFRNYPHDDENVSHLLDKIEAGQVVQYVVHPTQGFIYGTELGDYPAKYNLLPTLSGAVDALRSLPFEETHVIGLTAPGNAWKEWFEASYPNEHPDRSKRLVEATTSLEWLLDEDLDGGVNWVINEPDHPEKAARQIIDLVKSGRNPTRSNGRRLAYNMLDIAQRMHGRID